MADGTKIEWTDATWNVVNGCSVTSPGCANCYAMRLAGTRLRNHPSRAGLTTDSKAGPVWTGETRFNGKVLEDPLRWRRPRRIFVCAHGDLFHESVPDEWIDRVFAVIALSPHHQFQVLTKRAERMRAWFGRYDAAHDHNCADFVADAVACQLGRQGATGAARTEGHDTDWPLPNVWLGVSVEDQRRADERIPYLLATPAAVRWLSCEPLLGPVDLSKVEMPADLLPSSFARDDAWAAAPLTGRVAPIMRHGPNDWALDGGGQQLGRLDWIVAGGESGPGARAMHPDWARSLRNQCAAAGVPFLFKQWGANRPLENDDDWWNFGDPDKDHPNVWHHRHLDCNFARCGKVRAGRDLDGVQHDGFPA